jgi:hypothetical protein
MGKRALVGGRGESSRAAGAKLAGRMEVKRKCRKGTRNAGGTMRRKESSTAGVGGLVMKTTIRMGLTGGTMKVEQNVVGVGRWDIMMEIGAEGVGQMVRGIAGRVNWKKSIELVTGGTKTGGMQGEMKQAMTQSERCKRI